MSGPSDVSRTITALFDAHAGVLRSYLAGRVGAAAADDLTSDCFVIAFRRLDTFDPSRGSARSWLFGIATNELQHHWRLQARQLALASRVGLAEISAADVTDQVADRVDAAATARQLVPALTRLDPRDLDILLLNAWAGLTPTEIACALDVPAPTVRTRLRRTRLSLREAARFLPIHLDVAVGEVHAD